MIIQGQPVLAVIHPGSCYEIVWGWCSEDTGSDLGDRFSGHMGYIRFLETVGIFSWTFFNPLLCMKEKTETDWLLYANCFARYMLYVMPFNFSNMIVHSPIHSFFHPTCFMPGTIPQKDYFFPFHVCASWTSKKLTWFVQDFITKWRC